MTRWGFLGVFLGCAIGNFVWQIFVTQDYHAAFERTFFQGFAILSVAVLERWVR